MRKSLFLLIGIVFAVLTILTACGGEDEASEGTADSEGGEASEGTVESEDENSNGDKHKIGILAPAVTHGWVAAVAYHAESRAEELSDEIEYQIQTSSDAGEMTSQLDDLKTWGAEAIVAFPQWEGMEAPIQQALDEGIEIVNFDIEIDVDGVYRVAGDNEDMGIEGANYIVDKIGEEGTVVVLENPGAGSVSELRVNGFKDTIKEIAPNIELETYATEFTREDGMSDFADVLTSLDEIDAVFSIDDETSIGVLQAIEEAGRDDIQVITGGGGAQDYFNMMPENDDIWIQSALYSPTMVEDAVDVALKILNGEDVEEQTVIPTTVVDRENYEEFLDADSPY